MIGLALAAFPTNAAGGLDASLSARFASCACFTLVEIGDGGAIGATILPAAALVEAMKRGQIPQRGSSLARDSLRPGARNKMTPCRDVSRNAFDRVLMERHSAPGDALVNGRALRIKGGDDEPKSSAVSDGQIEES